MHKITEKVHKNSLKCFELMIGDKLVFCKCFEPEALGIFVYKRPHP